MAWQNIAASETDANSPLNQTLMDKIRGNLEKLGSAASGVGHCHDGSADGEGPKIKQSGLNTATGSATGSLQSGAHVDITMNDYAFFPSLSRAQTNHEFVRIVQAGVSASDTVGRVCYLNTHASQTLYYAAYWRYITASDDPFLFVIFQPESGEILHVWEAEDPPAGMPLVLSPEEGTAGRRLFLPDFDLINELTQNRGAAAAELEKVLDQCGRRWGLGGIQASGLDGRRREVVKLHYLRRLSVRLGHESLGSLLLSRFRVRERGWALTGA